MRSTPKHPGNGPRGFEREYFALCRQFPPRVITSRRQLKQTQDVMDRLLDSPAQHSRAQREYLNTLGTLVCDYEETHIAMPEMDGVALLHELIRERGLRQKDLIAVFKTESIASAVLNGRRELTRRHIEALARFFSVPAAAFLPDLPRRRAKVA